MDYCPTDLCPDVEVCECVGLGVCEFLDELPAVIDEGCGVARRPLRYAAAHVIVGIRDDADAVGEGGDESILGVPGVRPDAVRCQVAVEVVGRLPQRRWGAEDGRVLIQGVGRVSRRGGVDRRCRMAADEVVGVGVCVRQGGRRRDFRAGVVAEAVGVAGGAASRVIVGVDQRVGAARGCGVDNATDQLVPIGVAPQRPLQRNAVCQRKRVADIQAQTPIEE